MDESSASVPWSPRQLVFLPYAPGSDSDAKTQPFRGVVKRPVTLVSRLTKNIVDTYRICNPQFNYLENSTPKRFLTSPSAGVLNDGYDNENSDLILTVNSALVNSNTQRRYIVKDILGQGTFGQVAKCWVTELERFVAVKIIKNQPAYYQQAWVEVSILSTLNEKLDPEDKHHIVRIYDHFVYQRHLCIAFELLDANLYELIKLNQFRGLSLSIIQVFSKQILYGLALMKDAAIIHCDLKPENILLCTSVKPAKIKIIDFGSACMEDHTVYSYIQSRYYRSPEVLLGYQYTTAIDMWSFGCIVAELFLGLPLFPGASEFDLLRRMITILGEQPPDYVLKEAKNTSKFFKRVGNVNHEESGPAASYGKSVYEALNEEEYEARELKKPPIGKEYFNHMNLEAIVKKYPYRKNLQEEDLAKESQIRLALIDFLRGLVEFDPAKRWSPLQASKHPFVTGEPFTSPYSPAPETSRVPVSHNVNVNHHPAGGHWFAAGLSPYMLGGNRAAIYNSPYFQVMPYSHGDNYGSLGSHGSYGSYGSYGENNNLLAYHSPVGTSAMNNCTPGNVPVLGSTPDARRKFMQIQHGNGFGFNAAGSFAPMSLGTSPSQFTPPYRSPGHHGHGSPSRGTCHGSPLGKGIPNKRRGQGYSGNLQTQEGTPSSHRQGGQFSDVNSSCGQVDMSSPPSLGRLHHLHPNAANLKQQQRHSGNATGHVTSNNFPSVSLFGSGKPFLHPKVAIHDNPDTCSSLPDPRDWDPNYSDELLLQDDSSEFSTLTAEFSKSLHLSQAFASTESFVGAMSNAIISIQRPNAPLQAYTRSEAPPHLMPHFSQFSPGQLVQQPVHRFTHGRSTGSHGGEWNHVKVQNPLSNFSSGVPQSPGSNNAPWGRRGNHPFAASILPSSHGGNEYGRIM